jgi:hypothetical protein
MLRIVFGKNIDAKYNTPTRNPNILYCQEAHPSVLWKGIMLASEAVSFQYKWHVDNGQ